MAAGMRQRGHRHVTALADMDEGRGFALRALASGRVVVLLGAGSIGALAAELRALAGDGS